MAARPGRGHELGSVDKPTSRRRHATIVLLGTPEGPVMPRGTTDHATPGRASTTLRCQLADDATQGELWYTIDQPSCKEAT